MATAPPRSSLDLIAITADATTASITSSHGPAGLPFGGCNFVDLAPGSSGAHCGCRRFWTRPLAHGLPAQADWCMCGHHACYHDDGPRLVQSSVDAAMPTVRGDTGPRPGPEFAGLEAAELMQGPPGTPKVGSGVPSLAGGYRPLPRATPQYDSDTQVFATQYAPDSLFSTGLVQPKTQFDPNTLSRPPQHQVSSPTVSTSSSLRTRYLKPFFGNDAHILDASRESTSQPSGLRHRGMKPSLQQQSNSNSSSRAMLKKPIINDQNIPSQAETHSQTGASCTKALGLMLPGGITGLKSDFYDLDDRSDRLDGVSLQQEYYDRFENHDVRISELETRVDDVEKFANMANVRDLVDDDDDGTAQSTGSTKSAPSSNVHCTPEVMSRIGNIEAQVNQLQTFLPSFKYSWDVEVVFLPFSLRRVWQELNQFKSDCRLSDGEWTQLPVTLGATSRRSQSPFISEWAADDHEIEWMFPRACGDSSMVDKRLRSRGLAQSVSISGPDYRSVRMAIDSAFGKVFHQMRLSERSELPDARFTGFLGLQQTWVPLRKIHKDSRLRFLSPPEMVTPVSWDVPFLNTIMMKSAKPRLYITHPDAYLQDLEAWELAWTWQRLRLLSRAYPDVTESQDVREADAFEECWVWQENLDDALGMPPVTKGRKLSRSTSSSLTQTLSRRGRTSRISSSPALMRSHSSMLSGRRETVAGMSVTGPSPSAVPPRKASTGSKRPVATASHGQPIHTSPRSFITPQARMQKKRRTGSPAIDRLTPHSPRWSASPSPMPLERNERHAQRGTTPFAYATPFSNAPPQEMHAVRRHRNESEEDEDDFYAGSDANESGSDESMTDQSDEDTDNGGVSEEGEPAQLPLNHRLWPGIEGRHEPSDSRNADVQELDDDDSDSSSNPSEYPSADILADVEELR